MDDPTPSARGERTRQRLLDAAVHRFAENGYRATSLSGIARECAVTPAAVYPYFQDKERLFLAAFDADAGALLDAALPADVTNLAAWIGLLPRIVAALPHHPLAQRVFEGREPATTPRLLELSSARRLRDALEQGLRSAQGRGLARADIDPALIATGLHTVVLSTLLAAIQTGVLQEPQRRDGLLALIIAAVRAPEGAG